MRKLSPIFLNYLKSGFLSPITTYVRDDHDLNLEIREGYINIYFKGNSLLKLTETGSLLHYKADIHKKFLENVNISLDFTESTTHEFVKSIPLIKENINKYGQNSLELEYEQLIIRANNFEPRNNTEYFIVDKQYKIGRDRFDLTGIYWDTNNRQRNREVPVCLMEIKFALNTDIGEVHNQMARYYESIKGRAAIIAEEMETIFKQKLELKLYDQDTNRLKAMKELKFAKTIETFEFILILVDYNQNSSLLDLQSLGNLPFANQVKVFQTGFGMWQHNVDSV